MSREDEPMEPAQPGAGEREEDEANDPMRALLKRSLVSTKAAPAPDEFLRGVQKRIRTRSRGKFYADGWSTSNARVSVALVALVMLLVVVLAYVVLGPTGITTP